MMDDLVTGCWLEYLSESEHGSNNPQCYLAFWFHGCYLPRFGVCDGVEFGQGTLLYLSRSHEHGGTLTRSDASVFGIGWQQVWRQDLYDWAEGMLGGQAFSLVLVHTPPASPMMQLDYPGTRSAYCWYTPWES